MIVVVVMVIEDEGGRGGRREESEGYSWTRMVGVEMNTKTSYESRWQTAAGGYAA